MPKWTAPGLMELKGREKIVSLTAYDYTTAQILDGCGIHLILVGDSLGMTVLGYDTTLPVTVAEMMHHTVAVARGVKDALVVADMPFMSYHLSQEQALENAGGFIKDAAAGAVKIEGGAIRARTVETLVRNGIPVLGHIGLTPQSIKSMGGYKVQGKTAKGAEQLVADAVALEKAGAFGIVLECVPRKLAKEITEQIRIPTIGIGAGPDCDGQILVINDLLGLTSANAPRPKFVKKYADLGFAAAEAVKSYLSEVQQGKYPSDEHCYD